MHGVLLTLVLLGAGGEGQVVRSFPGEQVFPGGAGGPCSSCGHHGRALQPYHPHGRYYRNIHVQDGIHTGMPQTCYEPRFGCYAGSRMMHRYPAFHGYYYRRPYNYRHLFEYPWHAELHEPTSLFSYNVEADLDGTPVPSVLEDTVPQPPSPTTALESPRHTVQRAFLSQASHREAAPTKTQATRSSTTLPAKSSTTLPAKSSTTTLKGLRLRR